ncbi:MAG: hypothetical protein ABUJ92_00525 [Desulfobacterales bacterium]
MAFDVITPVKLGQAAITVATATLYTVPAITRSFVKDLDIANTTAAAISVNVFIGAGAASDANTLVPNVSIPANSIFYWRGSQIINATDTIQTNASAVGCTITASGGEAI